MAGQFDEYLQAINMPKTFMERVYELQVIAQFLSPEEITDVFVNDYIKEDGVREFEGVHFFSNHFVMEAKNFQSEDNIDVASLEDAVYYVALSKTAFDMKNSTEKSRINAKVYLQGALGLSSVTFTLKASNENCSYLVHILEKFVKPNL